MLSSLSVQSINAECDCLLLLSRTARHGGRIQVAMNAVTTAQRLVEVGERGTAVLEEFANVLWSQGEQTTAIALLNRSYPAGSERPATVLAQLVRTVPLRPAHY